MQKGVCDHLKNIGTISWSSGSSSRPLVIRECQGNSYGLPCLKTSSCTTTRCSNFLSSLFAIIHCGHRGLFLSCSPEHYVMPFVNIWYKIQTSHTKSIYMAIFLFLFMLFWLRYSFCSFPVHSSILLLPLDYDVSISSFFCLRNAIELHLLL